ncbi:hypothetical protein Hanom_Chr03g00188471 [Helianthus anomalus]
MTRQIHTSWRRCSEEMMVETVGVCARGDVEDDVGLWRRRRRRSVAEVVARCL